MSIDTLGKLNDQIAKIRLLCSEARSPTYDKLEVVLVTDVALERIRRSESKNEEKERSLKSLTPQEIYENDLVRFIKGDEDMWFPGDKNWEK
jgi:hypothetical protein